MSRTLAGNHVANVVMARHAHTEASCRLLGDDRRVRPSSRTTRIILVAGGVVLGFIAAVLVAGTRPQADLATECLRISGGSLVEAGSQPIRKLQVDEVSVQNTCPVEVSLARWSVRDQDGSNVFTFAPADRLRPKGSVSLKTDSPPTPAMKQLDQPFDAGWNGQTPQPIRLVSPRGVVVSMWSPSAPTATPGGPESPRPNCLESLQALVDATPPGATLHVPPCIYRESVVVRRPITLLAAPGAEIRGSDVWTSWERRGAFWVAGPLPSFPAHGTCRPGTDRCKHAEQVFVDGRRLELASGDPRSGQFAISDLRDVILGDDPTGHVIEVTTRTRWVDVQANDVTIEGFRMRHAAVDAQNGAIQPDGTVSRLAVIDCVLSDAHGSLVSIQGGSGHRVIGNVLFHGGQLGIHLGGEGASGVHIEANEIFENNVDDFDPSWEAGGIKGSLQADALIADNVVFSNHGSGIWCDNDCRDAVIDGNRVHDNERAGISYEISDGGRISDNTVWGNGVGARGWVGGAGILCNVCAHTEISGNVVAWNRHGIAVQSQDRQDPRHRAVGIHVHDNTIITAAMPGGDPSVALGWVQDFNGPLYDQTSDNHGSDDRYWVADRDGSSPRFEWVEPIRSLSEFNATPGEENGRYLADDEEESILGQARIPFDPFVTVTIQEPLTPTSSG
jgi:parallel beta-helix repeat protein